MDTLENTPSRGAGTAARRRPRRGAPPAGRWTGPRRTLVVAVALAGVVCGTAPGFGASGAPPSTAAADEPVAGEPAADPVDGAVDVTAYDVTSSYQPDTRALSGTTVISGTSAEALDSLTLHLSPELTARSVTVDGEPAASFSQQGTKDLVIVPANALGRGADFRVRVTYDGTPGPGWLPTTSGGATAFMGNASSWFVAHEDARDRADFHLTATVPEGWSVVSVGREDPDPVEPGGAGGPTFGWREPHVDPAHLAVSVDRLTLDRSALADGTPVVNAYAPGLRESTQPLAERLPEVLDFLSGRFGRYPFQAAGNVFLHVNDDGPATAPQTRPVYLGAGNATYMDLTAVVHEQAHQWYGISTAPRQPEDTCLSECFATYATWLWDEAREGVDLDARYREQVAAARDDPAFWAELYRPGQTPGLSLYDKGPLALHALRRQVGDEAFDRLLQQWPREHRAAYVDWPEFEAFAERVTGEELSGFCQAWFREGTVPEDRYLWPGPLQP